MVDIPYLERFVKVKEIQEGLSGDCKYYLESKEGQAYLLRISELGLRDLKTQEFQILEQLKDYDLPIPLPIEMGLCHQEQAVYSLMTWMEGRVLEEVLPLMTPKDQYDLGLEAGRVLKRIHETPGPKVVKDWLDRYKAVMDDRLEAFIKNDTKFEGCDKILSFLQAHQDLLMNRLQTRHHGDYHVGNMVVNDEGELSIIDWQIIDFDNYGDPWYDFNRMGLEFPAFKSGQIDGYFEGEIPEDFWILLAYYTSASAITSIVWAKFYSPDDLEDIIKLNRSILDWYDQMTRIVPTWYQASEK